MALGSAPPVVGGQFLSSPCVLGMGSNPAPDVFARFTNKWCDFANYSLTVSNSNCPCGPVVMIHPSMAREVPGSIPGGEIFTLHMWCGEILHFREP